MSEIMAGESAMTPAPNVSLSGAALRYGIKGAGAAAWLATQEVPVPARPNAVARWPGGRCLRLGNTEFLVEHDASTARHASVPGPGVENAWALIRSDHSVVLQGAPWPHALAHACSFDFDRLHDDPDQVVMTLFAGIAVTLIREDESPQLALRLWCDASFATYLHHCLHQLAAISPLGEQR